MRYPKITYTAKVEDGKLLDEDEAIETVILMQNLWPFNIELNSRFPSGEEINGGDLDF